MDRERKWAWEEARKIPVRFSTRWQCGGWRMLARPEERKASTEEAAVFSQAVRLPLERKGDRNIAEKSLLTHDREGSGGQGGQELGSEKGLYRVAQDEPSGRLGLL